MKKLLFLLLPAAMIASCSDNKSTTASTSSDTASTSKMNDNDADDENVVLAYSVPRVADWERGAKSNVAVAMTALRSYETNDMNGLAQSLADSVEFLADN